MSDLIYSLQARVRQLIGARGGPLVEAADFLQPVAVIASAEGPYRNPALELGEGIGREFVASSGSISPGALEFARSTIGCNQDNALVHVQRVYVNLFNSTTAVQIGRVAGAQAGLTESEGHYTDGRLNLTDLGPAPLTVRGGNAAAASNFTGAIFVQPLINSSLVVDVDYVLISNRAGAVGDVLTVEAATPNTPMFVSYQGRIYDFGPGAR